MESTIYEPHTSLLSKIKSKPLIIQKIFAYALNRPYILPYLINKDKALVDKLNEIFSKVSRYNNKLDKEFVDNLVKYSEIKKMNEKIKEVYDKIKTKIDNLKYNYLKTNLNFSILNYIYNYIEHRYLHYNHLTFDQTMIKSLIFGFIYSLDSFNLTLLPQKNIYLDGDFIFEAGKYNMKSQEKNKNNQKIKLFLLFDENYFFNNIFYKIKLPNIEELEIFFDPEYKELLLKQNNSLHIYLNNYLSKIDHLDKINKINFHNLELKDDLYQSILGYLFDGYYYETDENIRQQLTLMQNLKTVKLEMTFLYIYEKIKLYYLLYELFPLLNLYSSNKNIIPNFNFPYYLVNKIFIINNINAPLVCDKIISFIDIMMKNNSENIEFIFVINHNKLIIEEEDNKNEKDKLVNKIDLTKLREFCFINENPDDIKKVIDKFNFNNDINYHEYKGYDKENNLIYYRYGENSIESFDLIDLFKNNKILEKIEFIKEELNVEYNQERSSLTISYNGEPTMNTSNLFSLKNFSKFIKVQKDLKELIINRFNFNFEDVINDNIQILTINYEKKISTVEYKILNGDSSLSGFTNLRKLNLGIDSEKLNFLKKNIPKGLKEVNLIFKQFNITGYISRVIKKFKKNKREIKIETIEKGIDKNEEDDDDNYEEYEGEEEDDYYYEEDE
jgi:hypothetical protein